MDARFTFIRQVTAIEEVAGINCLKVTEKSSRYTYYNWYAQDTSGNVWQLQQYDPLFNEYDEEDYLVMPVDPQVGEEHYNFWLGHMEVMSTTSLITVPKGKFSDCLELYGDNVIGMAEFSQEYYAPGVGMVKMFNSMSGVELTSVTGLESPHVPGAPTAVTAERGNGQANVSFKPPASDGGTPITSFTVTSIPGGITATDDRIPITVIGLTNGTSYKFTVRATNDIGTGPASAASSAVTPAEPITVIGAITGTAQVGSILTAGALTPAGATATYQWSSCATIDGAYAKIAGATAKTYKPVAGNATRFLKVSATGTGAYSGTVTSVATSAIPTPLKAIGAITGTAKIGSVLTAGALTPAGATASYQWKIAGKSAGPYEDIAGATSNTYTPVPGDVKKFLKVSATGTGSYFGTVTSAATKAIPTLITSAGITGTAKVGSTLTACVLAPLGATATYQWMICDTADGTYANIAKATAKTYKPLAWDLNNFIKVVATGTVNYSGTATSAATTAMTAPIKSIGVITPKAKVGV
ncbi:MAG: fibronectin type III domain-containing protein, partial [Victivallales bacterium]